jgi:sugar/nucleoside kinase (ribokinase family)
MKGITANSVIMPGKLVETEPITVSTGGAVSNTGLALHRLQANVRLLALVGDDLISQLIVNFLRQRDEHLTEFIHIKPGEPASYTIALSPENADRTFLHCTGTNRNFGVADIDFGLVERAKIFHLGYPPILPRLYGNDGQELEAIYQQAKATGVITSLDMSLPDANGAAGNANWQVILQRTLPYVDIFLPSIDEIVFMLRRADYDAWQGRTLAHLNRDYLAALADELLAMGAGIVGFKLGEMGIYVKSDGRFAPSAELWHPAYDVMVAGTTGAGDAAYAGFLAAWLRDLPLADCLQWACAAGACCVQAPDATSGVRSWDETAQWLAQNPPLRVQKLAGF